MSTLGTKLGLAAPTTSAPASAPAGAEAAGDPLLVSYLLPLHGPVVTSAVQELVADYTKWTAEQVAAAANSCVAVLYASAYGNTAALAQAISRGITKVGGGGGGGAQPRGGVTRPGQAWQPQAAVSGLGGR